MTERYYHLSRRLGADTLALIQSSKILVVGAGGIGCELIKNLVLSGFENIVVVDLDTIDVSNLNRQFLFRKEHVGQPKALVARSAALKFNPRCSIEAHHANIKASEFHLGWFSGFAAAVNALDNVDARRHVNRMCLASGIPLIEAGTTGYLGQVFTIVKDETACYECFPKPAQKVYPICTIRSTPDKPVHCIVWAKELFKLLFGPRPEESMLFEDETVEKSTYSEAAAAVRAGQRHRMDDLLVGLFHDDVQKEKYKGKTKPISFSASAAKTPSVAGDDRRVWDADECAAVMKSVTVTADEFDKDDEPTMLFVAAAASLRCANFGIDRLSYYDAKGVAGNIVPAIATTNAIVAGLQVNELVKILVAKNTKGQKKISESCSYTYCLKDPNSKGFLLQPTTLDPPQKSCYVCRAGGVKVTLDTHTVTLAAFVQDVVKKKLNFVNPAIDKGESGLYDAEDERLLSNLPLTLDKLPAGGLGDNAICKATDYATDLELTILISHHTATKNGGEEEEEEPYKISGMEGETPAAAAQAPSSSTSKRPREEEGEGEDEPAAKKAATR